MRPRIRRHLVNDAVKHPDRPARENAKGGTAQQAKPLTKRPDMTWHDHLVMLLHIGAEIEHGLMVQYLYAAYSLGGEQVPEKHRAMVKRWQESVLAVAREEMGHLLSVQNILTLLGAPINLDRDDFPWDIQYYPFPFRLEPFTLESLSCYIYAEMPPESEFVKTLEKTPGKRLLPRYQRFEKKDRKRITECVLQRASAGRLHRVGTIYDEIIEILGNSERIPDAAFQEHTFDTQASWDDWGRGYQPDPRLLDAGGNLQLSDRPAASGREAHVIIDQVATRTQALAALRALSAQGEAPHLAADETDEPSHFDRFLEIYQEFDTIKDEPWRPSRCVPANPTTLNDPAAPNRGGFIEAKRSRDWAELFNLRYRILLTYLTHTFRLARVTRSDAPSVRAVVMHRVFGEMYNLKTIAGILVRLPLRDGGGGDGASADAACAGPPFEMPYNLRLPPAESDAWRLHRDLLGSSDRLCHAMLASPDTEGRAYLKTLIDLGAQSRAWIDQILAGLGSTERHCV